MKFKATFTSILLVITLLAPITKLSAQISYGGYPASLGMSQEINQDMVVLPSIDAEKYITEDITRDANGEIYRYGIGIQTSLTVKNSGSWTELKDGSRIWKLKIKSDDALGLGVNYSNFWLPEGGQLFLYNEDKSQIIGSYTHLNNHPSGIFANELIYGETVTLEYFSPAYVTEDPILDIAEIAYAYRAVKSLTEVRGYNDSDPCEVDAVCSEGNDWRDQQRSVARISVKHDGQYGWCTGSMVTNTEENCLPYFLTADHCADGASVEDVLSWIFYFNYEREVCNNVGEAEPSYNTISGAVKKARGGWAGSDFYLVLFTTYVPIEYDIFFGGWKVTNIGSTSGAGIHHPAGDIKKISHYTETLSNSGSTHWSVRWSATTNGHGVTEGGSSGSPLYNSDGYVIGTLTGGYSACEVNGAGPGTGPNKYDTYGKFSYSWSSNGTSQNYRLKDWLDPISTNPTTFDGMNQTCTDFPVIADFYIESTTVPQGTFVHFSNLTLEDPASNTSYLWEFEGVEQNATTFINSPNRTYNTPGIFPVILTATSNGISSSVTKYITVQSNSISSLEDSDISVYPNPAQDILNIEINNSNNETTIVNIVNIVGEVVKTEIIPASGITSLNVSDVSQGIYFVKINNGSETFTSKVSILK